MEDEINGELNMYECKENDMATYNKINRLRCVGHVTR